MYFTEEKHYIEMHNEPPVRELHILARLSDRDYCANQYQTRLTGFF